MSNSKIAVTYHTTDLRGVPGRHMNVATDHISASDRALLHASSCGSVATLLLISAGSVDPGRNIMLHHEMVVNRF